MKILHLILLGSYTDGYSYQENLLPKYHKKAGYDTEIITSTLAYDENAKCVEYSGPKSYVDENGIRITRLRFKKPVKLYRKLRRFDGLAEMLSKSVFDVMFIHGCQFLDIDVIARYLKQHPGVRVYVDNHADFHNTGRNFLSKNFLNGIIWKRCAKTIEPFTGCFYGVVPARVDFLTSAYGIPKEKCRLLEMGADDEAAEKALEPQVREQRRREYGVTEEDLVIVTGGKIDYNKTQVLTLMDAVNALASKHIRLVVFGSVSSELKDEFDRLVSDRVRYIGWRDSEDIYVDFAAADLVAFPGLHSVLWEVAVGMGRPCLFRRIKGFEHIDLGGNCLFFENDSAEAYQAVIQKAVSELDTMRIVAQGEGKNRFSYRRIAKKALEG